MTKMHTLLLSCLLAYSATAQYTVGDDVIDITTKPTPVIHTFTLDAQEPGSGEEEPLPECRLEFIKFEKSYLRGVKEPNHISFNDTTFEECKKHCCYETSFECRSFSYLEILKQCFIMNVTQHDRNVALVYASGHIHGQLVVIETTTPEPPTTPPFPTPPYSPRKPAAPKSDEQKSDGKPKPPDEDTANDIADGANGGGKVETTCTLDCSVGGTCSVRRNGQVAEPFCLCKDGYEGENCEKKISKAGFPQWLIAVIVIGLVLFLLLAVLIAYYIYYKKTGEYKVLKAIRKWARRGRRSRSSGTAEEFNEPDDGQLHTSPTTSVGSIHGSLTSSATHSTSTSV